MQNLARNHTQNTKKYVVALLLAVLCLALGVALFALDGVLVSAATVPTYSSSSAETTAVRETAVAITMTSSSSYTATDPLTILSTIVILGAMTYIALQVPRQTYLSDANTTK